ncbi:MAG: hypothetical protein O2909_04120 [Chloroflexi bacterium]|nr:hypothetical protein [Chloroflexota bacterium]MDA1218607.1 hypothetical protein [Chloroflexota bacterium]
MTNQNDNHPIQHIGGTVMVVMMDVEPEHEAEFNRWYDDEHLVERLEIPGYVSARRFKLEEGRGGVLKYLCIWEMDDSSCLESEEYKAQRLRPSELRDRVNTYITQRSRGVYKQIYPLVGSYEDHSGFHPEREKV